MRLPAYDGRNSLYTAGELAFTWKEFNIRLIDEEDGVNGPKLTVVFLAFDVFFAIFCVVFASLIGIALCCCFPCIIAILYAVVGQEGASDAEISILSKYRFQICNDDDKPTVEADRMVSIATSIWDLASERVVLRENIKALNTISMSREDQEQAFEMLVAVLWLGNISFQVIDSENHVEVVADEGFLWMKTQL